MSAASMPSREVPDIRPMASVGFNGFPLRTAYPSSSSTGAALASVSFPTLRRAPSALRARIIREFQYHLLRLLETRGYILQITDPAGLDALAAKKNVQGYIVSDPILPSLPTITLLSLTLLRPSNPTE